MKTRCFFLSIIFKGSDASLNGRRMTDDDGTEEGVAALEMKDYDEGG